jgi:uncharacterized protein (UPF0332 family)
MISENIKALTRYRLEQADESIAAASLLLQQGILRRSVNNAYYAMFYAVIALLAIKMMETSKHGGAISLFDREFVKTGVFSRDFSRWLHQAFDLRQRCDYEAQFSISEEEARITLTAAEKFVAEVKSVIAAMNSQGDGPLMPDLSG